MFPWKARVVLSKQAAFVAPARPSQGYQGSGSATDLQGSFRKGKEKEKGDRGAGQEMHSESQRLTGKVNGLCL